MNDQYSNIQKKIPARFNQASVVHCCDFVLLVAKECYDEYKAVRAIFSGQSNCLREQIYSSFRLDDYTGKKEYFLVVCVLRNIHQVKK